MPAKGEIDEALTFGIDLGIASCGWAVIRGGDGAGEIVDMGTWMFDAPETAKERTPTNQLRRTARGLRRVVRRRRQRMNEVRRLFKTHGLLDSDRQGALAVKAEGALLDPWTLRAQGLDRRLTGPELAVALGHIAKHRGFKSNRKSERGANAADDSSKMLKAIEATREASAKYRTIGELFARDEAYAGRKRNRDADYTRSILRADQEDEVRTLFRAQRGAGSALATEDLEAKFTHAAFFQRPLQDSEHMVGECPFERGEPRAARRAWSFELFRYLSRLTTLRIREGRIERPLTSGEIASAEALFATKAKVSFTDLIKRFGLTPGQAFDGVKRDDEKNDFVTRSGAAAEGSYAVRRVVEDALGEIAWNALRATPERLDAIAFVITFRDDIGRIREGLRDLGLELGLLAALMQGVEAGKFQKFSQSGNISAKCARRITPLIQAGKRPDVALTEIYGDHSARPETLLEDIANPVARKAMTEALKQIRALVHEFGTPGRMHIELARDVGKSKEERDEIKFGIDKRNKAKDRMRAQLEQELGRPSTGFADLERFELWKEQRCECLYCGDKIRVHDLTAADNSAQVDHILPWSRFGDDSFINKTLCHARCNQNKRGRTPFEWLGGDPAAWEVYRARVESIPYMKGRKKRNYTLKSAAEVQEKFRSRNLNDTRYATRIVAELAGREHYAEKERWRVRGRPGQLTSLIRRGWGVERLKKNEVGERLSDDRHHALDALICAATSDSAIQRLTDRVKLAEDKADPQLFSDYKPPWETFLPDTLAAYTKIFVARTERRRARGEAHAQTVRAIGEVDGAKIVYEKKRVGQLKEGDLARIKDPERNAAIVESLRAWIANGSPEKDPPLSPKGDPIAKVTLKTTKKVDVLIRDGAADRGEMVRVDVFRKANKRGADEFFVVPIYPHQVADGEQWPNPPDRAVSAYKPEVEWPVMDASYTFCWSLYQLSLIEVVTAKNLHVLGYFRGMNRATGALIISPHHTKDDSAIVEGIGARTLKQFGKIAVDRFGMVRQSDERPVYIEREIRTWRGAACT